jgi:hypothetical protein
MKQVPVPGKLGYPDKFRPSTSSFRVYRDLIIR